MTRAKASDAPILTTQVTVLVLLGFALAALFMIIFAAWAMRSVDAGALERERAGAIMGLEDVIERVPAEQGGNTTWDDAVLYTAARDRQWMDENIVAWVSAYYGHDEVYVLDPSDAPVSAAADGAAVEAGRYAQREAVLAPLVAELRSAIAAARAQSDDAAAALAELGASDFVLIDGVPAAASVVPIVPSSTDIDLPPGEEFLHISVRHLDAEVLADISGHHQLAGIHLLPLDAEPREAAVPILNRAGDTLGFLAWDADRPGTEMVLTVAPALVFGQLLGLLLVAWLLLRLRRSAARMHASETRAQFLAFHDTLTGLPNRALFEERLDRALAAARRSGGRIALQYIDIDRFKSINDTRGHPAGDELIRLVAKRLNASVRNTDTVARLGGDEFAVVQAELGSAADAEETAKRMLATLSRPYDLLGETVQVSASIGLVVPDRLDITRDDLLRQADIALYEAKARGRGRCVVFAEDMDEVVRQRRTVEEDLRRALRRGGQLKVVYQPIFAGTSDNGLLGAEALVRWQHPTRGLMSPALFIGVAEESGLISQLGEFVLREAATFAVESGLPWVSVNVSPVQLRDSAFPERTLAILAEVGLPPGRLEIEITEAVLLENASLVQAAIGKLRGAGVRIALDDFGTGYSSMSYLQRYSIDKLKIDQSFVAELGGSADAGSIVGAMIGLARSLKLQVTAEGVETAEQRDRLTALGCHELQGYLLSRPVAREEMKDMLRAAPSPQHAEAAAAG